MPSIDEVILARRAARAEKASIQMRFNVVSVTIILITAALGVAGTARAQNPAPLFVWLVIGFILAQSPKVAKQWERAVVLRLGKYRGLKGPGLFWIVPFVDTISLYIDQRV